MFDEQTQWTERPCYYVNAFQGFRRAWLAGPYRTRAEADTVLPHVISWATSKSGDTGATNCTYQVVEHHNGETRSILGEVNAQSLTPDINAELLEALTLEQRITRVQDHAWLGDPAQRMGELHAIIRELVDRLCVVHLGVVCARGEEQVAAALAAADLSKPFP